MECGNASENCWGATFDLGQDARSANVTACDADVRQEGGGGAKRASFGGDGVWRLASRPRLIAVEGRALVFVGETRLDNRSELLRMLSLAPSTDDGALICRLYLRHGDGFPGRLLGAFSFAIYDASMARLMLVRDQLGIEPLYYSHDPGRGTCTASNSQDFMLSQNQHRRGVNEELVAEWCMTRSVFNQTHTFYESIRKCPKATALFLGRQQRRSTVYWHTQDVQPLRYADERDYTAHLRELIDSAVVGLIDPRVPNAAHLSGGMDSSPIAILAGRAAVAQGQRFHTFNWSKPDSTVDAGAPDYAFARRVAQDEGFAHEEIGASVADIKDLLLSHDLFRDGTTMMEYECRTSVLASRYGIGQIFSGFGGDEALTCTLGDNHFDEIRSGRFLTAFRRMVQERGPNQRLRTLRNLAAFGRAVAFSVLPDGMMHRALRDHVARHTRACADLLTEEFRVFAAKRNEGDLTIKLGTIKGYQESVLNSGYHQERLESWDILGRRLGLRYVYPFLDRRIIEFALAIPSDLYVRAGRPRHLYTKALADVIPDDIRNRVKHAELSRVLQVIRASLGAFGDLEVQAVVENAKSPYVDTKALLAKCRQRWDVCAENLGACTVHVSSVSGAILMLGAGHQGPGPTGDE